MLQPGRVLVLGDIREEHWPSMQFVAEATAEALRSANGAPSVELRTPSLSRLVSQSDTGWTYTADRLINRFWTYPRAVSKLASSADVFHIIDHSYAQLVHALPAARTVVTAHDTDTFRCLISPSEEPRPWLFRKMTTRIASGLGRAAAVCCVSEETRRSVIQAGLVRPERARVVPNPVHPAFGPWRDQDADAEAERLLGPCDSHVEILNVGSTIDRKRVDRVLQVLAGLVSVDPRVRLVRVGGALTAMQQKRAEDLGVSDRVVTLPSIERRVLASVYRRATATLLTPAREGFCLPILESLACGTPVVVSDLPATREVSGEVATLIEPSNIEGFVEKVLALIKLRDADASAYTSLQHAGQLWAGRFSYAAYGSALLAVYAELT